MIRVRSLAPLLALVAGVLAAAPAAAQFSPGPLSRAHQKFEGTRQCTKCHEVGGARGAIDARCLDCHKALRERIDSGRGFHARGERSKGCGACHAEHHGREYDLMGLDRAGFDHGETGTPLAGRHKGLSCEKCHRTAGSFLGAPAACSGCHEDAHKGSLGPECKNCHDENAWRPAPGFDHTATRYPLTGKHTAVACNLCHKAGRLAGLEFEGCDDCHGSPHSASFAAGRTCASCHSTDGWRSGPASSFDHARTGFALLGAHAKAGCAACHKGGRFEALSGASCEGCHADAHKGQFAGRGRIAPAGAGEGRGPSVCTGCHVVDAWSPAARFDHGATRYPLTGAHIEARCARCHPEGRYVGTESACAACHEDAHRGELGGDCARCHTTVAWGSVLFRHERTRFRLEGRHEQVRCSGCHGSGPKARYASLDGTCAACHADPHGGQFTGRYPAPAPGPSIVAPPPASPADSAAFALHPEAKEKRTACSDCHDPGAWKPSRYDHAKSRFPLEGAHVRAGCVRCHKDGAFAGVPGECVSCHSDPHWGQFASASCTNCHDAAAWKKVRFDHRGTAFSLNGRHADLQCSSCHSGGRFRGLSPRCDSCHEDMHLTALGSACERCHTASGWTPSTFSHGIELFPLWGAHEAVDCAACHRDEVTWQVNVPPRQCSDCHEEDFRRAPITVHTQAGPDCERCHGFDEWKGAHDDAWFNIRTGHHSGVSCSRCHDRAPNYPDYTCDACHQGHDGYRRCLECHPNGFGDD